MISGPIHWKGASGFHYLFQVIGPGQEPAAVEGVYIFAKTVPTGFLAIYIGQSTNLRERISGHDRLAEARRLGADQIHVMAVPGGSNERIKVEFDLVSQWRPTLNSLS